MKLQVGGTCSLCEQPTVQTCSCCPQSFCLQHQMKEALGVIVIGDCHMFVCHFCHLHPHRIAASNMHHHILDQFDMVAQELYTAVGEWVSKYRPKAEGAVVSARTFSTKCFLEDIASYRAQVRGSC